MWHVRCGPVTPAESLMIYWICYFLMKTLDKIYFSSKFEGVENLPQEGGFIIACNHISNLDPFIAGICARRRFSFLAKESLFKNKILSFLFRGMDAFPIKRDTADFGALREALRRLKAGRPLILFPEGTRGVSGREKKSQPGVGFLVLKSQVPVLPMYISGSDQAFPNGAKWFRRHPVKVKIGESLKFNKDQEYSEISAQIVDSIYSLSS